MKGETERETQLRALAAVAERRNRPRALPIGAGALLVLAAAYLVLGASDAASARRDLDEAARQATSVSAAVAQIKAVRDDASRGGELEKYKQDRQLLAKLENVHQTIGAATRPAFTSERTRPMSAESPLQLRTLKATFTDMTLEQMMLWINAALQQSPGLHVTAADFRPIQQRGWTVEVELGRWELKQ